MIEEESLFAEKLVLARVRVPDPYSGGRMEDRIRGVELLHRQIGQELLVEGWVEGPCAESADLRGINRLMMDFSDDPAFVQDLFEFTTEVATRFAAAQIEAGADIIGIGDAAASLVGPRIYREFVWAWEKNLVDSIHAIGGKVRLHICGNTRRILKDMARLGCEMVDIDYPVPIGNARTEVGTWQTLSGNMDPVRSLRNGAPETITQSLKELQLEAGERWIVAAGCEVVRDTPHDNLHAMVKFAQLHNSSIIGGEVVDIGEKEKNQ
jgi:MtaA/CmuA family methyltransferase